MHHQVARQALASLATIKGMVKTHSNNLQGTGHHQELSLRKIKLLLIKNLADTKPKHQHQDKMHTHLVLETQ